MGDTTNISNISTYTTDDQQAIYNAYGLDADGDGKVDATFDVDGDGKVDVGTNVINQIGNDISAGTAPAGVAYEDLLSFYIDQTGELPLAGIPGPDQLGTDAWADEGALVQTLNQWRVESLGTDLATSLESLITTNSTLDITVAGDAEEFIKDYYNNLKAKNVGGDDPFEDMPNLVTNMVNICMAFGNPGMALLAYVVGFDAEISEDDINDPEDTTYSQAIGSEVAPGTDFASVNFAGPMGTVSPDLSPVVDVIQYRGLGDVVNSVQVGAIDVIRDAGGNLDDLIDDMRDLDPEDTEFQADMQEIQTKIDNVKTVMSTMTEFIKNAQDILDNVIEAAASLNEKQSRTQSSIISKI